jgi:hypothetical protein
MCSLLFPDRIAVDRWGFALVDPAVIRGAAAIRQARRAVRSCPTGALALDSERPPAQQRYT